MPRLIHLDDDSDTGTCTGGDPLRDYRALTDVELRRRSEPREGIFIAEGALVIERAVAAGYPVRSVLVSPKWVSGVQSLLAAAHMADTPVYVGSEVMLESITGFHVHRGALAAMARTALPSVGTVVASARRLVILEDVNSHTNIGAIFRSSAALGVDGVLLSPSCADPLYRRAVRVSMGTVFSVPYARVPAWPDGVRASLGESWQIMALTPDPAATTVRDALLTSADRPIALLVGCEGTGLSTPSRRIADQQVRIPMSRGVDSLNVAAAVAVACYALQSPADEHG